MSSVVRVIQILDLLAGSGALGVRAIAQKLQLPVGSAHRLLIDLAEENVVERTAEGSWELSYRLLACAASPSGPTLRSKSAASA